MLIKFNTATAATRRMKVTRLMESISNDGRAVMAVDWDEETGDKTINFTGVGIPFSLTIDRQTCIDLAEALQHGTDGQAR